MTNNKSINSFNSSSRFRRAAWRTFISLGESITESAKRRNYGQSINRALLIYEIATEPVCRCSIVIESLQQWPTKKLSYALYPDDAHRPWLRTFAFSRRTRVRASTPARGFVWSMRREMNRPANTRDSMDRTCSFGRHLGRYLLDQPIRLSSH
jgi:hypothetical protein